MSISIPLHPSSALATKQSRLIYLFYLFSSSTSNDIEVQAMT